MRTTHQLLGQFIEAWNAGERPDVRDYLARASADERDDLSTLLSAWLELAPTPAWDEATLDEISATPALRAALEAAATLLRSGGPSAVTVDAVTRADDYQARRYTIAPPRDGDRLISFSDRPVSGPANPTATDLIVWRDGDVVRAVARFGRLAEASPGRAHGDRPVGADAGDGPAVAVADP